MITHYICNVKGMKIVIYATKTYTLPTLSLLPINNDIINNLNYNIMTTYNYLESVKEDVRNYIEENAIVVTSNNREELEQELNDTLFTEDSVTGNASGSYTFSTWQAEENLCHNIELLQEALTEFGCDISYLEKGAEACDVTIRCYLLSQAISEVLDEIEEEPEEDD